MKRKKTVDSILRILQQNLLTSLSSYEWEVINDHINYCYVAGFEEGRRQTAHGKPVLQMKNEKIINRFDSLEQAAAAMKVGKSSISKNCLGKMKSCKGYNFIFEKDYKF